MVTQGANVRRGVLIFTTLFLTLQFAAFVGSAILYLYASTDGYRGELERFFFTKLYEREKWRELRAAKALEFHTLISCALQLLLLFPSIILIVGASKRIRFLLLPWLIVFGIFQVAMLFAMLLCVTHLPSKYKLLSAILAVIEAFFIFPWWFAVIHLFAVFTNEEDVKAAEDEERRSLAQPLPVFPPSRTDSSARGPPEGGTMVYPFPAHFYGGGVDATNYHTLGRSTIRTRMSEV